MFKIIPKLPKELKFFLLIYVLLSLVILPFFRYQIDLDATSYLSIAHKYLNGEFSDAINGYWGVLYSWLLIPLLAVKVPDLLATKILGTVTGFLILIVLNNLLDKFNIRAANKKLFYILITPSLLFFTMYISTPDLLLALLMLIFLNLIYSKDYINNFKVISMLGLISGLAYLTKHYSLFFISITFLFFNFLMYKTRTINLSQFIKSSLCFYTVFYLICLAWIVPMSLKYNKITLGNAAKYNWAIFGPGREGNPFDSNRLIEPPNKTALSIWEDPSFETVSYWNPFGSLVDLKYQFFLIRKNTIEAAKVISTYSFIALPIMFLWLMLVFANKTKGTKVIKYTLIFIFVYVGGYTFFVIDERYFWVVYILLQVLAIAMYSNFFKKWKFGIKKILVILILIISFYYYPIFNLVINANRDNIYYQTAKQMQENKIDSSRIATNKNGRQTLFLSYNSQNKYLGQTGNYEDLNQLKELFRKYNVQYYLVWQDDKYIERLSKELQWQRINLDKQLTAFKINF